MSDSDDLKLDSVCCVARRTLSGITQRDDIQGYPKISRRSSKVMALVTGGEFLMGTDDSAGFPSDGEGPVRKVLVNPFYMDISTVTNAQFTKFAKATRYKTEAENFGWSFVFHSFVSRKLLKERHR